MTLIPHWELRARFAQALSDLYGTEVPAYTSLLQVSHAVNADFTASHPERAERFGSIDRVTAERHGAIRVGSPEELAQVARVFAAIGMHPVGFYDLRDAKPNPIPVISTAFRPTDRDELAKNPFRVFTSMLVPQDRRFFTSDLEQRLTAFIASRQLFASELLVLADRSVSDGGLSPADADEYLTLSTAAFALSDDPVERAWYDELEAISSVASDIGGVSSTHINHLTPRVLDIDDLYERMTRRGITMIDTIQGPPLWDGPQLLLRQTSFRALAEPRVFRDEHGNVGKGDLSVRFGEVEARGIALTRSGRDLYDSMVAEVDRRRSEPHEVGTDIAGDVWREMCPPTELTLLIDDLAFFNIEVMDTEAATSALSLVELVENGCLRAEPIVYEDFLPRSAAGIFASNLSSDGLIDLEQRETVRDAHWLADRLGVPLYDPYDLYAAEREASFTGAMRALGLDPALVETPWS